MRFEIQVYDRAADLLDLVAMRAVGDVLQDRNWDLVVDRVVERSGGSAPAGVHRETATLDQEKADRVDDWL